MNHLVKQVFGWNKIANFGKTPDYNRHLEVSMLQEEVSEFFIALKENNRIEMLDACADIMFVLFGTMQKQGFTEEQIVATLEEVIRSNYTKFQKADNEYGYEVTKDESGKILKPFTYEKPVLSDIARGIIKTSDSKIVDITDATRIELIDTNGRQAVYTDVKIEPSLQDNGKTIKFFVSK